MLATSNIEMAACFSIVNADICYQVASRCFSLVNADLCYQRYQHVTRWRVADFHLSMLIYVISSLPPDRESNFSCKMAGDDVAVEENCDDNIGLGCALEMFSEHEEVITMIEKLRTVYSSEVSAEKAYERLTYILNLYREQPHLLDPHLDSILNKLISIVRNGESSIELKHATFKYLYTIMNVRSYKVVIRHLPHEVRLVLCYVILLFVLTFLLSG